MNKKIALLGACSALALALGGCGSDSSPAAPAVALSGTAATGAPIAGATVVIRCTGGSDITTTTDAAGGYSVTVPDMTAAGATMPCALEVTVLPGPTYLYGLAEANGTANITPLTNLAVAQAVGGSPDAWFAAGDSVALTFPTTEEIAAARTAVETALEGAAGEATVPFNIFTEPFDAGSTDAYDVWLDQFNAALTADGTTYGDLVTTFVGGGGFGTITIDVTTPGGGTGSSSMNVKLYMNGSSTPASDLTFTIDAAAPTSQAEFCDATTYIDPADYTAQGFAITECSFSGGTGTIIGTITSGPATYPFRQDITWI